MKFMEKTNNVLAILVMTTLVGCIDVICARAQETSPEALFRAGEFEAAAKGFQQVVSENPSDGEAQLRLAEIEMLRNDLAAAEKQLALADSHNDDSERLDRLHAEWHYRRNQFCEAAPYFRTLGSTAMADKLESFGDLIPYQVAADQPLSVTVPFAQTDPLPVVELQVDGSEPIFAIIDTGGPELILDPEFAKTIEVMTFGSQTSTFAGDKQASYEHGRVQSVTLGDLTVGNVPVKLLPTRRFAMVAGGRQVDAILGTIFLKQFRFSLDYIGKQLIVTQSTAPVQPYEQESDQGIIIPFYLAGDHIIVARGKVNDSKALTFFVDTGLAGQAFTCPQSTIEEAGIQLSGKKFQGLGGGGPVEVELFSVETLSLGEARKQNMTGLFGPFPKHLETSLGFQLDGLISHAFFRSYRVDFDFEKMTMTLVDDSNRADRQ